MSVTSTTSKVLKNIELCCETLNKRGLASSSTVSWWEQQWSSTNCGFDGIGGRAVATAITTLIEDLSTGYFYVFHNARFAYEVLKPTPRFREDVNRKSLMGKVDFQLNEEIYNADIISMPNDNKTITY